MSSSGKPAGYRRTGCTEAIRQTLHVPASGRVRDCQSTPANGGNSANDGNSANGAKGAKGANNGGPVPFTATRREKVGWAKAQFPPCPLLVCSVPDLIEAMWALRDWADNPSYRKLERRAEILERKAGTVRALPHATLHRVMTGCRMPRLEVLELFVKACGAEAHWDEWRRAWFAVNADLHVAALRRHGRRGAQRH